MSNACFIVPEPKNEPVRSYLPGSAERASLKAELKRQSELQVKIPLIIGGREVYTDTTANCIMPHDHQHVLGTYCIAGEKELKEGIKACQNAKNAWAAMPWQHRASIFLKAADLLAGPYRDKVNAATMLGQSKTAMQAEIDSACELIDFLRFSAAFMQEIYNMQPNSTDGVWNRQEYRPLDGFIVAVSPFNFTSIGGNLPTAPAVMGNTVIWKPSSTSVLSNYYFMQLLMEAGLPAGVINFIPSRGSEVSKYLLTDPDMAGFHFTGSTGVFQSVWKLVGEHIATYKSYPRLVGETGGKDFIFAHASASVDPLVAALVRGAFEYQGQKCSAASRAFIPASLWNEVKEKMGLALQAVKMGDVQDFTNFLAAVIDEASFDNCKAYIDHAKAAPDAEILFGGHCDKSVGYFVEPTVILAKSPNYKSMVEEIFGPILTIYVYEDEQFEETLHACDTASPYALTGAIWAQDRETILQMETALQNAAGNFYINDKPTGAVIAQQPFGGARASGTNDKAGSVLNLIRWASPRTIKETFAPTAAIAYPFMDAE